MHDVDPRDWGNEAQVSGARISYIGRAEERWIRVSKWLRIGYVALPVLTPVYPPRLSAGETAVAVMVACWVLLSTPEAAFHKVPLA
jgi:hypothetical protein